MFYNYIIAKCLIFFNRLVNEVNLFQVNLIVSTNSQLYEKTL